MSSATTSSKVSKVSDDRAPLGTGSSWAARWGLSPVQLWGHVVALLACVAGYLTHALYIRKLFANNACDDAFISFRYVDLLVREGELAYNIGERVEGFSNLLWMLLLVPSSYAGVDIVLASQILGLVFGVATMVLAAIALVRVFGIRSPLATALACSIMASSGYFAAWSVLGLESMLHGFLIMAAWLRFTVEWNHVGRRPWSGVLFALLAMTRPEGLLMCVGALGVWAFRCFVSSSEHAKPDFIRFLLAMGLPLTVYEAFRVGYYDGIHLWPNSVRAKVGLSSAQIMRGVHYVMDRFLGPYMYLAFPIALSWHSRKRFEDWTGPVFFVGLVAFVATAGGDWSVGRFFAPLIPIGALSFTVTIFRIAELVAPRPRLMTVLPGVVMAAVVLASSYRHTSLMGEQGFVRRFAGMDTHRVKFGKWIDKNTTKDASVALYAAGQIAYHARRYAHDMLGLNDAHIGGREVKSFGKGFAGHEKFDVEYTLNTIHPTFIVQGNLIPGMVNHATFKRDYVPLPGWGSTWVLKKYWEAHLAKDKANSK